MRFPISKFTVVVATLFVVVGGLLSGCIESRCYGDADCPAGRVCLEEGGGKCVEPECTAAAPCPAGYLCVNSFCDKGCLTDEECGEGFRCVGALCTPYQESCDCTGAPPFCAEDLNPNSASAGQEVCSDVPGEGGIALFFGSIKCSHCWSNFKRVEAMRDELLADGYPVDSYFVHLKTVEASSSTVGETMSWASSPVVADNDELAIWDDYLADWYHLVIVDRHGCVAQHFGPVVPSHFDGEDNPIRQAWIDSISSDCPGPPAGGDIVADTVDVTVSDVTSEDVVEAIDTVIFDSVGEVLDLLSDAPVDVDPEVQEPGEISSEVETSMPDGSDSDGSVFQPAEFCQVVPTEPIELGDEVPTFLCVDDNAASATYNGSFSAAGFKGKVWLAYFGSCT
jgi:hypothetical protein